MTEQQPYQQQERGMMVYPSRGWRKWAFQLPVSLWRLGLGSLNPPNFLLLTTTGRKSGLPRPTMLEYVRMDESVYLFSGWGERAQWVKNLQANPLASVQLVRGRTIYGRAVRVTGDQEIARLYWQGRGTSPMWKEYLASWEIEDRLEDILSKKERLVIFRIDPVDPPFPAPLQADLAWVWPLAAAILGAACWLRREERQTKK
jgi:deazaflavin-dependent oxidoreductase (nitroreductase family)